MKSYFINNLKNKKGDIEELVKMALWIILFIGLIAGVYFLIKNLAGTI